jgi:hypothetical protein
MKGEGGESGENLLWFFRPPSSLFSPFIIGSLKLGNKIPVDARFNDNRISPLSPSSPPTAPQRATAGIAFFTAFTAFTVRHMSTSAS